MRVISGKYKGKQLLGYDIDGTRPTMDRVKESMLASVQNNIKNAIVLDLFAGSGSLGIEALSNGALQCYFVDNNRIAIDTIKKNINGIDGAILLNKDYKEALKYLNNVKFDVIFLDPPYHDNLMNNAISLIEEYDLLNKNGIIICEYEEGDALSNYSLYKDKKYGTKYVKIYKK